MRTPMVRWFNRFDLPESGRLLMFDFGLGPVLGRFKEGEFFAVQYPGAWDRVLVNKWRYCEATESAVKAVA
jgi:hypothetical protein